MKTISGVPLFGLQLRPAFRTAAAAAVLATVSALPAWAEKYASIVVDMDTDQVLHARNADEDRFPASLTKVMTLYLVFDALEDGTLKLNERIPVSKYAAGRPPSKLGLKAGSTIKVEDAIRALVTKSANDVAVVVAERLGGSESKFARKMTDKAKELGLEHTTFRNASGLPDAQQTTTARDLAKLAEAVYEDHRGYYSYFSTPEFVWNRRRNKNHNTLLDKVDGVDGIKTGYTNASGYNLMASAERDGHRVIAVMLGGTTGKSRDAHVTELLEAAFLHINGVALADGKGFVDAFASDNGDLSTADALAAAQLRRFQSESDDVRAVTYIDDDSNDEESAQGDADASAALDMPVDDTSAPPAE
ncbi:MAG: D-alanyl-D-alanine carboxypeptidase family protein [Hyphomonadaceae bacterium]